MRYKLALFDLDGTVLDTLPDLAGAVNYSLSIHGLPMRPLSTIRRFISNGVKKLIERSIFVPQSSMDAIANDPSDAFLQVIDNYTVTDSELFEVVFADFVQYYRTHYTLATTVYPGITEMLGALKANGFELAMVTNKRDDLAKSIMDFYLPGLFALIIGDREGHPKKPSPDSVLEVLERLKISAEEAIYIGDSNVDIETASNAHVDSVAVTWGYRDLHLLTETEAIYFATTPASLAQFLINRNSP